MNGDEISTGEIVRWLKRLEEKSQRNGDFYASRGDLAAYRELADNEHRVMREDIDGIKEGLRWAVRLGITMFFTNLGALIFYLATRHV